MFISTSSVCKSLQYITSALTQGIEDGHLFRLTCSIVVQGGGTLQTNITGMCGECLQRLGHIGFAPAQVCVLSWSTPLRLQVALQGNCLKRALGWVHFPGLSCSGSGSQVLHTGTDWVGPAFCALPGSEQLRRPDAWRALSTWVGRCILSPPQSWLLGFPGAQWEHLLICAMCLLWGADLWL